MSAPIFLVGYMASGKTTLGRYAGRRMGREFIDLDRYIESRFRQSIPELFVTHGEERFREIERNMLREVGEFDNVLIATGGGTPCFYDNMAYMKERGTVVFLTCSVERICQRLLVAKVKRPLVLGHSPEELPQVVERMIDSRMSFYLQAHYTFEADRYEHRDALDEATARLQELIVGV